MPSSLQASPTTALSGHEAWASFDAVVLHDDKYAQIAASVPYIMGSVFLPKHNTEGGKVGKNVTTEILSHYNAL